MSHLNMSDERMNKLDLLLVFFCLHFPLVARIASNLALHLFSIKLNASMNIFSLNLDRTHSVTWIDSLNRLKIRYMFTILIQYLLLMPILFPSISQKRLLCIKIFMISLLPHPNCRIPYIYYNLIKWFLCSDSSLTYS